MRWSFLLLLLIVTPVRAQDEPGPDPRLQWFQDAKLGIFIHWGIYAVDGVSESWSFHNGQVTHEDYMKQLKGFTAKNYDPEAWADLIEASGARYSSVSSTGSPSSPQPTPRR